MRRGAGGRGGCGPGRAAPAAASAGAPAPAPAAARPALASERKQVTVLFADIATSTELIRSLDPEEALALLDSGLHLMIEAVHRYEGTVSRVMGDGIVALFGAPLSEEDHAVRACYAALTMQEMFARDARARAAEAGVSLTIRVGLHSGEVVVRALETDVATDYSAVGLTTHLAARMEQTAVPGMIQMSAETTRLSEGYVEVRALGAVEVKGLAEPVATFELLGASAAHTRLQIAASRGLAPLVGREAELAAIRQALARAGGGAGQVVALVGEPGVGKSRLVWEMVHSDLTAGWTVLDTSAVAYGRATPYRPLADLIRAHVRIEAADDVEAIRDKVTAWLLAADGRREALLAPLLELLDVPVEDEAWRALPPAQRRRRTIDACLGWLLSEAERQPLALVFEDLHWIDTETQAVLDSLVDGLDGARLLLLVNYRPEYRHEWGAKGWYTEVRVEPLATESADSLLTSLLGDDPGLRPIKQLLIERTEGVPFFIEECVRILGGRDALQTSRGGSQLVGRLADLAVPDSVQAILAARIDRLPAEEKLLLQSAAVIGRDVPLALLREVAGLTDEALRRAIAHLQETAFLYEARRFPDVAYTFTHSLTQSVSYESVLLSRRRALHARLVDEIERLYAGRLAEQVERLAQHALRGEVWERAVTYCQQAGLKAAGRSANREAASHFEQALGALRRLPESRERSEQAVDLIVELGRALHPIGEHQRCLDLFREASALAEGLGDRRRLARAATLASRALFFLGEYRAAIDAGRQTLAAAEALGDVAAQAEARSLIAQAASHRGDFGEAVAQYRRVLAATAPDAAPDWTGPRADFRAIWQAFLAWCLASLGDLEEARRIGDEAIRPGTPSDQPYALDLRDDVRRGRLLPAGAAGGGRSDRRAGDGADPGVRLRAADADVPLVAGVRVRAARPGARRGCGCSKRACARRRGPGSWPSTRCSTPGWGRRTCGSGATRMPRRRRSGRSRSRSRATRERSRGGRGCWPATWRRRRSPSTWTGRRRGTVRRWRSPSGWGCARWRRTAIVAWGCCIAGRAEPTRPRRR